MDLLPASVLVSGPVVVKTQRRPQNRPRADGVADTEARSESAVPVVLKAAAVAPAIGGGESQCAWAAAGRGIRQVRQERRDLVINLGEWRLVIPAQSVRQREGPGDAPFVLPKQRITVEPQARVHRDGRTRREDFAEQETGERIPLRRRTNLAGGEVAERERPRAVTAEESVDTGT